MDGAADGSPRATAPTVSRDDYIRQCQGDGSDTMRFLSRSDGAFYWVYGPDALLVAREARRARHPPSPPPHTS